jgi:hypothetical protein
LAKGAAMTDQAIPQTIPDELRGSFDAHAADTVRRLNALETQLDRVLDRVPGSRSKSRSRRALRAWYAVEAQS